MHLDEYVESIDSEDGGGGGGGKHGASAARRARNAVIGMRRVGSELRGEFARRRDRTGSIRVKEVSAIFGQLPSPPILRRIDSTYGGLYEATAIANSEPGSYSVSVSANGDVGQSRVVTVPRIGSGCNATLVTQHVTFSLLRSAPLTP